MSIIIILSLFSFIVMHTHAHSNFPLTSLSLSIYSILHSLYRRSYTVNSTYLYCAFSKFVFLGTLCGWDILKSEGIRKEGNFSWEDWRWRLRADNHTAAVAVAEKRKKKRKKNSLHAFEGNNNNRWRSHARCMLYHSVFFSFFFSLLLESFFINLNSKMVCICLFSIL